MIGGYWFDPTYSAFWIRIGAGAWQKQVFSSSAGYLYPTGDGTSTDFVSVFNTFLNTAINLYPGVSLSDATVSMLTTSGLPNGLIRIAWDDDDALGALQIAFSDPADPLQGDNVYQFHNILKMTSTITSTISISGGGAGTATSSRVAGYSFYPIRYMMDDLDMYSARVMQAVPDSGMPQTVLTSFRTKHRIGIRTDKAYPRSIIATEYDQLLDFMRNASTGRPFRLYPDVNVTTVYANVSNPFGYSTYVLDKESANWEPEPAEGNWYKVMDTTLTAWEV
jgi:hypothetical protein